MLQVKKGVKRKADTTTPGGNLYMDTSYGGGMPSDAAKISNRRESTRQVKKVNKDLLDVQQPIPSTSRPKERLRESLKACNEILKELFSKKHSTYAWPFYKPVDADLLGLHDYHEIIKKPMDLSTVKVRKSKFQVSFSIEYRIFTISLLLYALNIRVRNSV